MLFLFGVLFPVFFAVIVLAMLVALRRERMFGMLLER